MATGTKRKRQKTTPQYLAALRAMIRAAGRRVAWEDPELLVSLAQLGDEVDEALLRAVAGQRAAGITWQSIGDAFGTTRQNAIIKWSKRVDELGE